MQEPWQTVQIDRSSLLVDVTIAGFLSPEDVSWLGEDVRKAILTLGSDAGRHVTLYDASELGVVRGDTMETLKSMFDHPAVRALWARKVAIVSGSALGRLQMRRLCGVRADITIFEDRGSALEWLLAA